MKMVKMDGKFVTYFKLLLGVLSIVECQMDRFRKGY